MTQLFRPEALAARQHQWLGNVRLSQPISNWLAGTTGIAVAAAIGAFAFFGTYTKKATVTGLLVPGKGAFRVTSNAGGVVTDVRATEGAHVAKGDVLFVVSGERVSELGETQALIAREFDRRSQMTNRNSELSKARWQERIRALNDRIRAIDAEISSFANDAALHAVREKIAADNLARFEQMASTGFVSKAQLDVQLEQLLGVRAQAIAASRSKATLQRERLTLAAQIDEASQQRASEEVELVRADAVLAQERAENQARSKLLITAPADGIVTALIVQSGDAVSAGGLLATLIPQDVNGVHGRKGDPLPLAAHFYVSTRQSGFLAKGQSVLIRYAAYPYQQFGMGSGEVVEISNSPYAVHELPAHVAATMQAITQSGDLVYRVTVRLGNQRIDGNGAGHALKPGMLAEADILLDTRRLWEWLLEPVLAFSEKSRSTTSARKLVPAEHGMQSRRSQSLWESREASPPAEQPSVALTR